MRKFILGLLLFGLAVTANATPSKKIILVGKDNQTNIAWLSAHHVQAEQAHFDGLGVYVLRDIYGNPPMNNCPGTAYYGFSYSAFDSCDCTWGQLAYQLAQYQAITFTRFLNNFLVININPVHTGGWTDNAAFAKVNSNMGLAARFAFQAGMKGMWLDPETVGPPGFYEFLLNDQADKGTMSLSAYGAIVFARGQDVMNAIQAEFPNITLILAFAHSILESSDNFDLLPYFFDGMMDVAGPGVTFYDGQERAYADYGAQQYRTSHNSNIAAARFSTIPVTYAAKMKVGFGIEIDSHYPTYGWSTIHPSTNYFSPEVLCHAIGAGLAESDEYMWMWQNSTPGVNFLTGSLLTPAYYTALACRTPNQPWVCP